MCDVKTSGIILFCIKDTFNSYWNAYNAVIPHALLLEQNTIHPGRKMMERVLK